MSKKLKTVLITSLLLNLFFISLALGRWANLQHIQSPALAGFLQSIPAEARPLMRENIKPHRRELLKSVHQLRQGRQRVSELLSQPELDDVALAATMKQVRDNSNISIEILHQGTLQTLKKLPNEARLEWVKQWKQGRVTQGMGDLLQQTPEN